MKNLTAVANNHFASKLLPGLASFYQHTSQVVGEMNQWYTKTYNIMNEDSLYKLSDLVSYLQVADGKFHTLYYLSLFKWLRQL